MKHNVVAPSVGESITEVSILKWAKPDGSAVKVGEVLLEIESDKATVEVVAEANGVLQIGKAAGEKVPIGAVLAQIDDAAQPSAKAPSVGVPPPPPHSASSSTMVPPPPRLPSSSLDASGPAAKKLASETGTDASQISGLGKDGRITKGDILDFNAKKSGTVPAPQSAPAPSAPKIPDRPGDRRVPMTRLRQKIAERLVQAQHTAAILTTFNEVDMGKVMAIRKEHKDSFQATHGVPLSFMSFFTRGCVEALKALPAVNGSIDGTDIVYHDYCDIGIAVGTDRGLVVPIIRSAEKMGFVDIEKKMAELATKARNGKLSIADMSGGTFTISNGGVYGSLLSTPILTPPQTAILGMHKIQERPMAINGKVEIRPMMYLALSYDHRLIDGKEAVTFLVTLKDLLENPEKLGMEFANGRK